MGSVDSTTPPVPVREIEFRNGFMDSRRWDSFPWRDDDIVIATYAKSGTTWTQQIARQLVHKGSVPSDIAVDSPWVDLRLLPLDAVLAPLVAADHRRFVKTHLPRRAMVFRPQNKYLYVARDGRDMIWSFVHHLAELTDEFYEMGNAPDPERRGRLYPRPDPPNDPLRQFRDLVDSPHGGEDQSEEAACSLPWAFWSHIRGWYEIKDQPNVMLVHFSDLKRDMAGEMRRIAEFLETPEMTTEEWDRAVEHCTFDWMKENADQVVGPIKDIMKGGGKTFMNKGTNGRWREMLSEDDVRRYRERAEKELGAECARWLENGRLG